MHLTIVSPFPPAITGIGQYGYHVTRALANSGSFSRVTVLAGAPNGAEHPNHLGSTELEYCWQPGQINARQTILARLKRLGPDLRALDAPGGPFASWGARLLTRITTRADVICLTMRHYADWLATRGLDCAHIPIGAYHEPVLLDESGSDELLFFTTLAPFKGLELLLEAFHTLRSEYPQLRLTIAGTEHTRFPNYARDLKARFDGMDGVQW